MKLLHQDTNPQTPPKLILILNDGIRHEYDAANILTDLLNFDWEIFDYCCNAIISLEECSNISFLQELQRLLNTLSETTVSFLIDVFSDSVSNYTYKFYKDIIIYCSQVTNCTNFVTPEYIINAFASGSSELEQIKNLVYVVNMACNRNTIPKDYLPFMLDNLLPFRMPRYKIKTEYNNEFCAYIRCLLFTYCIDKDYRKEIDLHLTHIDASKDYPSLLSALTSLLNTLQAHNFQRPYLDYVFLYILDVNESEEKNYDFSFFLQSHSFEQYLYHTTDPHHLFALYDYIYERQFFSAYNSQENSIYIHTLTDFIRHEVLYFSKNKTSFKKCKYCQKIFLRLSNNQKTCNDVLCKRKASNKKALDSNEMIKIFGFDIFTKVKAYYKRTCCTTTRGKTTLNWEKYVVPKSDSDNSYKLTADSSKLIVKHLEETYGQYERDAYQYLERYKSIPSEFSDIMVDAIIEWLNRINTYSSKNIRNQLKQKYDENPYECKFAIIDIPIYKITQTCQVESHSIQLYVFYEQS